MQAPICFPHRKVPMDPYALGLLLGDGCVTGSTTPSFSSEDFELAWSLQVLLPGAFVVLVTWLPPNAREQEDPKNKLPPKYASPTSSPLRATVKSGTNELEPFRLTK